MAFVFQLGIVPTGSFALRIVARGETMPAEVAMVITGSGAPIETGPLEVYPGPLADIYDVALTDVVPFGDTYSVDVLFDGVTVYTVTDIENPVPDKRRAAVLRQRIYEVISAAYDAGDIEAEPIGSPHGPGSITQKFKARPGTVIEVGVGYIDRAIMNSIREQENEVVIPLTGYASCDEMEDASELMAAIEEVIAHLLSTDWRLNGFQMNQSQAEFDSGKPTFTDDRKLVVCAGSLRVPMRRYVR